jgi:hypothetical protein
VRTLRPLRCWLAALLPLWLLVSPLSLRAQSTADQDALYQAAKADLKAGRAAVALEKLNRGLAAGVEDRELRWTYLLAITIAHDALKQRLAVLEAMQRLEQALQADDMPAPPKWRARVGGMTQRVAALEAEVLESRGSVHTKSDPPGARVFVNGQAAGVDAPIQTPFTIYLPPGLHQVRLELAEHEPHTETIVVKAGEIARLDAGLLPKASVVATPIPDPEPKPTPLITEIVPPTSGRPAWLDPTWGWVTAGAGAVVLFAGIPFSAMAIGDQSSLGKYEGLQESPDNKKKYDDTKARMEQNQAVAAALYSVGAVVAAGGAAWLIVGYTWESASDTAAASPLRNTSMALVPVEGGALMTFGGRF